MSTNTLIAGITTTIVGCLFSASAATTPSISPTDFESKGIQGGFHIEKFIEKSNREDYWKLVMDARFHKAGKDACDEGKGGADKEPGYIECMLNALDRMLSNIGKELTAAEYEELHRLAVLKVKHMVTKCNSWRTPDRNTYFGICSSNCSDEGKKEFKLKKDSDWKSDKLVCSEDLSFYFKESKFYAFKLKEIDDAEKYAKIILDEYYEQISHVKNSNLSSKLEIIIRICQNLDQAHLFPDGNIRTIAFLVLNKFLIENGMYPTIMDNPNVIDMKSIEEISNEIKKGQQTFIKIFGKF